MSELFCSPRAAIEYTILTICTLAGRVPFISSAVSVMVAAAIEPFLKGDTGRNTRGLLRLIILLTIAGAAVASRLFSVIRKLSSPLCQ